MATEPYADKIRVGHVVDCLGAGGIASGVFTLIRSTAGLVDHTIVSLSGDLRLLGRLPPGTSAHVIAPGPSKLVGFCARLGRLTLRRRIDVLHCNNQFAWLDSSLVARVTGRPCLQTFHGVERPIGEIARDRLKCKMAARLGGRVTAVGEASRRMVCELSGLPEEAVEVVPNGIDLARFRPGDPKDRRRATLRAELAVGPDTELVVHVAGLRPVKDQGTLLRAWRSAAGSGRRPGAILLIVGEGSCRAGLEALVEELGIGRTVRFLGQRFDLDDLLPACDAFVLSSISEGLSFAILEAMACALPVVATRVGGNSELVEDGETGFLVPPRDPEALAAAMGLLLDRPMWRLRMGGRGRDIVERHHDAARSARRFVALYREMMSGPLGAGRPVRVGRP